MAATLTDLADAVAAALNVRQPLFTHAMYFKAERLLVPVYSLSRDMADLKVTVVPRARTSARLSRGHAKDDTHAVDIAVQQRVSVEASADVDAGLVDKLLLLVEEVGDYLMAADLASPRARLQTVENDPAYDPAHMEELRQFTSVITATYRIWRE
jgi:hypothetical protein